MGAWLPPAVAALAVAGAVWWLIPAHDAPPDPTVASLAYADVVPAEGEAAVLAVATGPLRLDTFAHERLCSIADGTIRAVRVAAGPRVSVHTVSRADGAGVPCPDLRDLHAAPSNGPLAAHNPPDPSGTSGRAGAEVARLGFWAFDDEGHPVVTTHANDARFGSPSVTVAPAWVHLGQGPAPPGAVTVPEQMQAALGDATQRLARLPEGGAWAAHVPDHPGASSLGPLWVAARIEAWASWGQGADPAPSSGNPPSSA